MPATTATVLGRQFSKLSSTEPSGFALLAGDALVDLWFREMPVPRLWRVNLATELDFRKNHSACFISVGARFWRRPPTSPLYYERKAMKTIFPKTRCAN